MKYLLSSILLSTILLQTLSAQVLNEEYSECRHKQPHLKGIATYPLHPKLFYYDVEFYFLDIELTNTSTYISGKVTTDVEVTAALLDTFVFELIPVLIIDSVFVNGIPRTPVRNGDEVYLPGLSFSTGQKISVEVFYHGNPSSAGSFFSGISNGTSGSWGVSATWTLSEPFNAKQWWPSKQLLSDKADSAWIFITTDTSLMAGSNGILTAVTPVSGGKHRFEWKTSHPIDYYLVSAAVADYIDYSIYAHPVGYPDSVLIQNYIYDVPTILPYFKTTIDETADLIELFSDLFGIYPYADEKYGHCLAPFGGGMEHQTMTSLGWFSFSLVAHELGHQWFGDYVTCATWSDIWINEGFASYTEYIAYEHLRTWADAQAEMASVHQNVMSQPDGSVYIPPQDADDENRIFSGRLSYDKGSAIIHMIRHELNDDSLFYLVMKTFLSTYGDNVATGDNFKQVMETLSGNNYQYFFDQWYYGEGYPVFDVEWAQIDPNNIRVIVKQSTSSNITTLFKMPYELLFKSSQGDTSIRVFQNNPIDTFYLTVNKTVNSIVFDPDNWMLKEVYSIKNTTGIETIDQLPISIFPNPAKSYFYIKNENLRESLNVKIYNQLGALVKNLETNSIITAVDLQNEASGMYIVRITNGEIRYEQKVILY